MPRPRAFPLAATLLLAAACAPAVTQPPPAPPEPARPVLPPPPALTPPAQLSAGGMPADTQLYVEIAGVSGVVSGVREVMGAALAAEAQASIAKALGVSEKEVVRFVDAIESIHVGGRKHNDDFHVAVSLRFADTTPMRDTIAQGELKKFGVCGVGCTMLSPRSSAKDSFWWLEDRRLLTIGDEPMRTSIVQVSEGRIPGLGEIPRAPTSPGERRVASAFVAPRLLEELASHRFSFPAPLLAAFGLWDGGMRGSYKASLAATNLRGSVSLPPPRALAIARRLPAETAGYLAISTGVPGGRAGAQALLSQVVSIFGQDADRAVNDVDRALSLAQLRLADVLGALGDEGVVGLSVRPGVNTKAALEKAYAVVIVQELRDTQPAEALLRTARELLQKNKKKEATLRPEPGGFTVTLKRGPVPFVRAKIAKGTLFVGVGQKDLVDRAVLAVDRGKGTLAADAAHARALGALPASAGLRLWVDMSRALDLAASSASAAERAPFEALHKAYAGPKRLTSGLSFTATVEDDRLRMELDEVNGIGALGAIGIFGVRRYLSAAKAAEAKNTIGAIRRGAAMAYEREQLGPNNTAAHKLCKSAVPVPSAVPKATKYLPSTDPGHDWNTGDQEHGWRCLKFQTSEPVRYQYTYIQGGPYKGPKRGGPDPGPNGFEIAAEGDLDGDGVTSLFTLIGTVDPKTDMVRVSRQMFVDSEDE